jgi:hypothetical protein
MVLPAEAATAAAATAKGIKARKVTADSVLGLDVKQALAQKVQMFGRMKADSSSSGKAAPSQQQLTLSKQEMEQQLDKLTAAVSEWKRTYSSSGSSSSNSSSGSGAAAASEPLVGFELTQREVDAAELAAEFLELVKASAAAKAAAAVATNSNYIAKSAGLASAKLGTGLEALLRWGRTAAGSGHARMGLTAPAAAAAAVRMTHLTMRMTQPLAASRLCCAPRHGRLLRGRGRMTHPKAGPSESHLWQGLREVTRLIQIKMSHRLCVSKGGWMRRSRL